MTKRHEPIPKTWPVQPLKRGRKAKDKATCEDCGLSWDDGKVTSMTPAPAARCPFEAFHVHNDEPSGITIAINFGNAAMKDMDDVAVALRCLAQRIEAGQEPTKVMDLNGNSVGTVEYA